MTRYTRRARLPAPEVLDRHTLEMAALLLLGVEWKRPLAALLGPHHPSGPRDSLDPRLPFRWLANPLNEDGTPNKGHRPIPAWVWPVLSELLHQRALDLAADARDAQRLHIELGALVRAGEKK